MTPSAIVIDKLAPADHDYPKLLAEGLEHLGWNVIRVPATVVSRRAQFLQIFERVREAMGEPVVFSINYSRPLVNLALELGFRYVWWGEVYPLVPPQVPELPEGARLYGFEGSHAMVEHFRKAQVTTHFLPIGFDARVFRGARPDPQVDVAFVGNGLAHMPRSSHALREQLENAQRESAGTPRGNVAGVLARLMSAVEGLSFEAFERQNRSLGDLVDEACQLALGPASIEPLRSTIVAALSGSMARKQRIESLVKVAKHGSLAVFGRDWDGTPIAPACPGSVDYDNTPDVYRQARVNLHIHRFYMNGINDRLFNVPACGGFLLARETEELRELFEPGVEIATYRTLDELEDQVQRHLADEPLRRKIAEAGQRRAHAEHRFTRTLEKLLDLAGLPSSKAPPSAAVG